MFKKNNSPDFRTIFLLEFTKEIIRGTDSYLKIKVEEEVRKKDSVLESSKSTEQKRNIKNIVRKKIGQERKLVYKIQKSEDINSILSKNPFLTKEPIRFSKTRHGLSSNIKPPLRVPKLRTTKVYEPQLPPTVSHLSPLATQTQIDLGKLNSLARDPLVKVIEVSGKNQKVTVSGMMGHKKTQITLNENEIRSIVKNFSQAAKIPFEEGFFKVAIGRFIISAIVSSQATGSKFILKKIGGY